LAAAVVVGAIALVLPRLGNDRRLHEVDRFHKAGQITSDWARAGVTAPVLVDDAAPRDDAALPDEAGRADDAEPSLDGDRRHARASSRR
jgi:hypothetical protein